MTKYISKIESKNARGVKYWDIFSLYIKRHLSRIIYNKTENTEISAKSCDYKHTNITVQV